MDKKERGIIFLKLGIGVLITFGLIIVSVLIIMTISGMVHYDTLNQIFDGKGRQNTVKGITAYGILGVFQEVGFIVGPIFAVRICYKKNRKSLGLTSIKKDYKHFINGFLLGTVGMTIVFVVIVITNSGSIEKISFIHPYVFLVETGLYILVGIGEEVFSRGLFLSILKETKNKVLVFLIPSVFFGIMHLSNAGVTFLSFINLIIFGLVFAYAFYKTGNLWMPIGIHIAWNFFQGVVFGFHVSGNQDESLIKWKNMNGDLLNGGEFGPEAGLIVMAVCILIFLLVKYIVRDSKYDFMND